MCAKWVPFCADVNISYLKVAPVLKGYSGLTMMAEESEQIGVLKLVVEEVEKYSSLRRGDHLIVPGEMAAMDYYHHGIFLGHEIGIADFGADEAPKTKAKPRQIDLFEFTDNGKRCLMRFIYPEGTCHKAEAAAHLAEEVIRDPRLWGPYHLISNNCEHFATRCKTGKAYSLQIEEIKRNPLKLVKGSLAASFKLCASLRKKKEDITIN